MGRAWYGRAVARGRVASGREESCKCTVLRVGRIAPLARERSHVVVVRNIAVVFRFLRCITRLLWQSSSTEQRMRLLLYGFSMVGGVGGWVAWSVGGVSCSMWVAFCRRHGRGCRVGAVVVLYVASFPCRRTLMYVVR